MKDVQSILSLANKSLINLTAEYIAGNLNILANRLSRGHTVPDEWSLNQDVFLQIIRTWEVPTVNLTAAQYKTKVATFYSFYREDNPLAVDTSTIP